MLTWFDYRIAAVTLALCLSSGAQAELPASVDVTLTSGQSITLTKNDLGLILIKFGNAKALMENRLPIIGVDGSVRFDRPLLNGNPVFYGSFGGNTNRANLFCKLMGFGYSTGSYKAETNACRFGNMTDVKTDAQGSPSVSITNRDIDGGWVCDYFASITCK